MAINRKFFFDYVRSHLFNGTLKQKQVDGMNGLLDYWDNEMAEEDDRWLAYVLATVHHECDQSMQPIKEYGSEKYFWRMYDIEGERPKVARALGNVNPGDGVKFYGRGFVQLTGRKNYQNWSNRLGVQLIENPDLALDTEIASKIIFEGMRAGTFTGKNLENYFDGEKDDWMNARRIINGLDKANLIAGYGKQYYAALSYTK
ncbi:MAG: glycoside hydrolase family 19 protein [Smithella sp.]